MHTQAASWILATTANCLTWYTSIKLSDDTQPHNRVPAKQHPFLHNLQLPQGRRHRFSTLNMGRMDPSQLWEYCSKILCWMPFLTQPQLKIRGSVFGREPSLWRKHQLTRQIEQMTGYSAVQWLLISQLASIIWRLSLQCATWRTKVWMKEKNQRHIFSSMWIL